MPTYPQKENWGIWAIVVPPNSMAGGFVCILYEAQDDEAKAVVKTDSTGDLFVVLFEAQDDEAKTDSMTETSP